MEEITNGNINLVFKIAASTCILSISFQSVQYIYKLESEWVEWINYMYQAGFMIGCLISERYYSANVQWKAVIIAYTLTMCSGISLSLFYIIERPDGSGPGYIVLIGYTLSGIGQSLLLVLLIAYTTPIIKADPTSVLLPIILVFFHFPGIIGTSLSYFIEKFFATYQGLILLLLNLLLLFISYIISWTLKGIPTICWNISRTPEIPFSHFNIVFYTVGVSAI